MFEFMLNCLKITPALAMFLGICGINFDYKKL